MSEIHAATAARRPGTRAILVDALARPYRVTAGMVVLITLVPLYLFLPALSRSDEFHSPSLALDGVLPLLPMWAIVYGALYLYLIVLPILVVRSERRIRQTVNAYLSVWITAYLFFIAWPTVAPRPALVTGQGFAWDALRFLYGADPPYNCFPSLHVAHSFVSALACLKVDRRVGRFALACASLVALSTLFTKQHYVVDVIAGVAMAYAAAAIFLRGAGAPSAHEQHAAPVVAAALMLPIAAFVFGVWIVSAWVKG
jgi:membrane-associated phospholipid phosphatase